MNRRKVLKKRLKINRNFKNGELEKAIISVLEEDYPDPLTPKQILERIMVKYNKKTTRDSIRKVLENLIRKGIVRRVAWGKYTLNKIRKEEKKKEKLGEGVPSSEDGIQEVVRMLYESIIAFLSENEEKNVLRQYNYYFAPLFPGETCEHKVDKCKVIQSPLTKALAYVVFYHAVQIVISNAKSAYIICAKYGKYLGYKYHKNGYPYYEKIINVQGKIRVRIRVYMSDKIVIYIGGKPWRFEEGLAIAYTIGSELYRLYSFIGSTKVAYNLEAKIVYAENKLIEDALVQKLMLKRSCIGIYKYSIDPDLMNSPTVETRLKPQIEFKPTKPETFMKALEKIGENSLKLLFELHQLATQNPTPITPPGIV